MIVTRSKRRTDWLGTGLALRRFRKGHDDALIDWDTHERKISRLTKGAEPAIPARFVTAIETSRCLLKLGPDWDDAGAGSINEDTWKRATDLLRHSIVKVAVVVDRLQVPNISPCADGSIDIFWKNKQFTLLVNIQASDAKSDFYGETADGLIFEGTFPKKARDFGIILMSLLDY